MGYGTQDKIRGTRATNPSNDLDFPCPVSRAPCPVFSSPDINHGARGLDAVRLVDAVAGFFLEHHLFYKSGNFVVAGSIADQVSNVMLVEREEAGSQFAVGCDADAAALPAE